MKRLDRRLAVMLKTALLTVGIVGLIVCGEASAQDTRFGIAPCAGLTFPEGELANEAETGFSLGVRLSWFISRGVALEGSVARDDFGEYTYNETVNDLGVTRTFRLRENRDYTEFSLRLRFIFGVDGFFAQSFAFGLGMYRESARTDQLYRNHESMIREQRYTDTNIGYQAVLGFIFWADRPRQLAVELAFHDLFGDRLGPFGAVETPAILRITTGLNFAL